MRDTRERQPRPCAGGLRVGRGTGYSPGRCDFGARRRGRLITGGKRIMARFPPPLSQRRKPGSPQEGPELLFAESGSAKWCLRHHCVASGGAGRGGGAPSSRRRDWPRRVRLSGLRAVSASAADGRAAGCGATSALAPDKGRRTARRSARWEWTRGGGLSGGQRAGTGQRAADCETVSAPGADKGRLPFPLARLRGPGRGGPIVRRRVDRGQEVSGRWTGAKGSAAGGPGLRGQRRAGAKRSAVGWAGAKGSAVDRAKRSGVGRG
ncbi:hypothetical protein BJY16_003649 [Actinoplanes octamycinicus]|uniref:Uncharacterized protein n=1 Tax=Actinoplanes octamycinicus TaxID=135948 RepID=A0A7W7M7U8_9ACTN|nr:hypothetical protein [Actinoplanes octamycinicus]